jgi:prepilin-type N-terminal cleavage/methylation domain-containing protein
MQMNKKTKDRGGFTLVEIMIVVALIGLLSAIAIPSWVRARVTSQTGNCINNLRQIDAAKQQWAIETSQSGNSTPLLSDITPYLKNTVACPSAGVSASFGSSYQINSVANKPVCQIVGATHVLPQDTSN